MYEYMPGQTRILRKAITNIDTSRKQKFLFDLKYEMLVGFVFVTPLPFPLYPKPSSSYDSALSKLKLDLLNPRFPSTPKIYSFSPTIF